MGKRDMKNKTPPSGAKSQSLVLRLNTRLFFRQLGIFLCMDLLLVVLALMGQLMWAEKRCADVAQLVQERGVPTAEAVPWMAASDYTIIPLDREPKGVDVGELGWFSGGEATADGLRTYVLFSYYTVELPNGGEPYAITVDLSGIGRMLKWAGFILLTVQIISLIANLFRNAGTIRRTLRPIQELAATAARLNSMTHMSRRELEALAGELSKINATHLDSRIDLPGTQKELKTLAKAINDMLDRVNAAYSPRRCSSSLTPATSCVPPSRSFRVTPLCWTGGARTTRRPGRRPSTPSAPSRTPWSVWWSSCCSWPGETTTPSPSGRS